MTSIPNILAGARAKQRPGVSQPQTPRANEILLLLTQARPWSLADSPLLLILTPLSVIITRSASGRSASLEVSKKRNTNPLPRAAARPRSQDDPRFLKQTASKERQKDSFSFFSGRFFCSLLHIIKLGSFFGASPSVAASRLFGGGADSREIRTTTENSGV